MIPSKLPELEALERIIELGAGKLETRVACEVKMPKGDSYPVHVNCSCTLSSTSS